MGYLRHVVSPPKVPAPENGCLVAFSLELDYLFETLRRLGAAPREIEDLVQEVFMVLQRKWHTFDTTRPLRPYLFGVAFRIVSAQRRRSAREVSSPVLEVESTAPSAEGLLQRRQSVDLLLAGLERVPLPRRAVLVMHDLDGIPVADIAEKLAISRFGAYARLRKARKELAAAVRRISQSGGPK